MKSYPVQIDDVVNVTVFSTQLPLSVSTGSLHSFKYQLKMAYLAKLQCTIKDIVTKVINTLKF